MKKTIPIIAIMLFSMLLLTGCMTTSLAKINENPDAYMGKKVLVQGTVVAPIDFGKMKGFTLKADNTTILVSVDEVPMRNHEVVVRGTVVKGVLMGPYIFADKVNDKGEVEK